MPSRRPALQPFRLFTTDVLDPGPEREALIAPQSGAVNMPVAEIPLRTHELPAKDKPLQVAAEGDLLELTLATLAELGRSGTPIDLREAKGGPGIPRLWSPNAFLEELCDQGSAPTGSRALDLACGSGRDAVYLADRGWTLTAVDHLGDALEKGRDLERRYSAGCSQPIHWKLGDLRSFEPTAQYDLITMFFFLDRDLLRRATGWLSMGGAIVIETFTTANRERFGKPKSDELALLPGELPSLFPELGIVSYAEGWHEGRHTARLLARAPERA